MNEVVTNINPFLKWAGGKRWLFDSDQFVPPAFDGNYIEPFLGGGAVFFRIAPLSATLSDTNNQLIELYRVIKEQPLQFETALRVHAAEHCKEYYYEIRSKNFDTAVDRAARFLYLNRTCYNGLYRENKRGEFNVPIGTKDTVIFNTDDFLAWSSALRNAKLVCQDFERVIDDAGARDFVFADPPYTVMHNLNGFVKYNQNIFAWEDQERLCEVLKRASDRGVLFAMTNADHPSIHDLYEGFGNQKKLRRYSVIAGGTSYRSKSTELCITNF